VESATALDKRIGTSFVKSAVSQLIDKRISKSQQMRWSHAGRDLLLHVRADAVDGRLASNLARWHSGFRERTKRPFSSQP